MGAMDSGEAWERWWSANDSDLLNDYLFEGQGLIEDDTVEAIQHWSEKGEFFHDFKLLFDYMEGDIDYDKFGKVLSDWYDTLNYVQEQEFADILYNSSKDFMRYVDNRFDKFWSDGAMFGGGPEPYDVYYDR